MDDQQQQRINRAAQQVGARQIEYFFDAVIGNLRAQAGGTSQMVRQLASQQRLAQETTRDLARVSTDNYMDLLDSVFSFYQGGSSRTQRRTDEARGHIEEAETRAEQAEARAGEAQGESQETRRSLQEAQRRTLEAESRAEEAESRGGDEEGDTEADAASQPQSPAGDRRSGGGTPEFGTGAPGEEGSVEFTSDDDEDAESGSPSPS